MDILVKREVAKRMLRGRLLIIWGRGVKIAKKKNDSEGLQEKNDRLKPEVRL